MERVSLTLICVLLTAFAARAGAVEMGIPAARLKLAAADDTGLITRVTLGGADLTAPEAVAASGFSLADGPTAE